MRQNKDSQTSGILELNYQLAELPSSQHRAGLAGLVLMTKWLARQRGVKGTCKLVKLGANGASLRLDLQGLESLFDQVYAASNEEQERKQPLKDKAKKIIKPLRVENRKEVDFKTGEKKTKKVYIYPVVVPKGAFLPGYDKSKDGDWIKLWRDVIWSIFRGVPATRKPYQDRADELQSEDATDTWKQLAQASENAVDLPSTYFIGAQASNAENVPFKDRARFQFLLHFWPFVAQAYVPAVVNNEGERDFVGFALAVPDVADLKSFSEELPGVLANRGNAISGYRPRDSVIDLAVESGLDILRRLQERISRYEGEKRTGDLVLGIDVLHVQKQGNNIRLLGVSRVDPEMAMIDEYALLRKVLWNPIFRRQRLLNLVNKRQWYEGFDGLLSRVQHKDLFAERTSGFKYFSHDVREHFPKQDFPTTRRKEVSKTMDNKDQASVEDSTKKWEALIYRMIGTYISRKLKSKYQLEWEQVKDVPPKKKEYQEMKEKIAKDAFLAVRSRNGMDFANYFASTICSVSQHIGEEDFVGLAQALHLETEKVRTLTMLALSARS